MQMKKVIIVDASPRKDGNSDFITEKLAAEIKDAEIEKYYLREKPVNPCHACDACKGKDAPACVQKDDMGQLISRIDACDALIMVTPIYFNRISGPATMFIDRLYCFFDPAKPGASNATKRGKKAALICSCGGGPVDVYTSHAESTIGSFALMGADETKVHVCGDANAPGSCKDHADDMKAVSEIAAWI
jgi:multimeric flavodoxin WrbA